MNEIDNYTNWWVDESIRALDPIGLGIGNTISIIILILLSFFVIIIGMLYKIYVAHKALKQHDKAIYNLKKSIEGQEKVITSLAADLAYHSNKQYRPDVVAASAPRLEPVAAPKQVIEQESPDELLRRRINQFIQEYNELMSQRKNDLNSRDAKRNFFQKHRLRGFVCTNYEFRVSHPEIAPTFAEETNASKAIFWAMQIQGEKYAVVPNLNSYEEQNHQVGGMKEVFESNFNGGSYSGIKLVKPALFTGLTQLKVKGELQLTK